MSPARQTPEAERDFLSVARQLGMLTDQVARDVAQQAHGQDALVSQLVLQKGLLSPIQIDIVQTLLHPDEIIPGYEIIDVIGHGGMGVVYRARQTNLDRIVALKTILVSQLSDRNMVARFEQEARTVAKLQHPNIIAAYDFGRHEGRLYFAMELVEGEDLEQLIRRRKKLDEAAAWGIARQVAAGLSHAANERVVHRDIKPANILLVKPPEGLPLPKGLPMVKIADFGLSFLTQDVEVRTRLTSTSGAVGSPHYMAPEQLSDKVIDHRADIYALGATVFHMLAGRLPFSGNVTQIFAQKMQGTTPDLGEFCPDTSRYSRKLVDEMLQADREKRLAGYDELLDRIDAIAPNLASAAAHLDLVGSRERPWPAGSLAPTQPLSKVDTKRSSREPPRRRVVMGILVVLLAGLAVVGVSWFPRDNSAPAEPNMELVGASNFLFTGSLEDWMPYTGVWSDTKDEDGAVVISGQDGVIRRELLRSEQTSPQPIPFYRLSLSVRLNEASAAELQFGIAATGELDSPRGLLRVTRERVVVGHRQSNAGELETATDGIRKRITADRYHAIRLERRRFSWWAYFDDELVGTMPAEQQPQLAEFRLAAEGGPVWFADVAVQELRPVDEVIGGR
jgi:serine/threonine protein kinase